MTNHASERTTRTLRPIVMRHLGRLAFLVAGLSSRAMAGTWTPLVRSAPGGVNLMIQLSDGTVAAAQNDGSTIGRGWFRLTPDIHGSYINGTWSILGSMIDTRLYYSSALLQDGRLFVAGGEYGTGASTSEIYNPLTNLWTANPIPTTVLNPAANSPVTGSPQAFLDSMAKITANGSVLITPVAPRTSGGTVLYNPITNTWTNGPRLFRGSYQDEASWVKLPDDSILTIDPFGTNSERYIPASNTWINDGVVPVSLYDPFGFELGAALLLPNGKAFFLGSTGHTALYTPTGTTSPGTWVAGPDIPGAHGTPDAPAAMMVNGNILCAVSAIPTSGNHFPSPTSFYEYDYIANAFTAVNGPTGPTDNISSFEAAMLVLPDGGVLYSHFGSQLYVYTPTGAPLAAGKPVVNTITSNLDGSYHLTGTGLNGISEGAAYGDDLQMDSNYPLVRLTSGANVYYARTFNWSRTSVMTGAAIVTTEFRVPANLQGGTYSLYVVANGIASDPVTFNAITDCNNNGIPDATDIANATSPDCNSNAIPDECDVPPICANCADCNHDLIPDICQVPPICPNCLDCNANQVPDACEVDCNANSIPDACDVATHTSPDCQSDGVPDECQIPPLCPNCKDCNHNNIPDACDIAAQTSLDCQGNNIPDECELPPLCPNCADCNANNIPDVCDVITHASPDCQADSIPDECQLPPLCPACPDCNHNNVPDLCDVNLGNTPDCNQDGIPDPCQTSPSLCGGSCLADCDQNLVPDSCQLVGSYSRQSPNLSPFVQPNPQTYLLTSPPVAAGNVTLTFKAVADIDSSSEFVSIALNGTGLGNVFASTGFTCPLSNTDTLTCSAATWNAAVAGGNALISMQPNALVDGLCAGASYISVKVEYATTEGDCNLNGVLDACELASGATDDCNANNRPDSCDIQDNLLTDLDHDGRADQCGCGAFCHGDLDLDAMVDGRDIAPFMNCLAGHNLTINDCGCADMNNDNRLDNADVQAFVTELLTNPTLQCP